VAKVLLVDDESVVRGMLRRLFERGGFEVLEAESGREALVAGNVPMVNKLDDPQIVLDAAALEHVALG
jgi:CheY-like chemotaxis protein